MDQQDRVVPPQGMAVGQNEKPSQTFQEAVVAWCNECFGPEVTKHMEERMERFFEESVEQVHSLGFSKEKAHAMIEHVYSRPLGEPTQEAGGVQVTHAALCEALKVDAHECGRVELKRISDPVTMKKIGEKQLTKPQWGHTTDIYPTRPAPSESALVKFMETQQPLGEAYERLWDDNVDSLYEK